jgi:myo-inositol-1(or 4)-monophosphatase
MNLENICTQVCQIANEASTFIKSETGRIRNENIEIKGLHNFVTYVDKTSEKIIVDGLKKVLPEAGFIAEEGTENYKAERYNWVIDPLDGTTNFIHGLPPYAISIALLDKDEVVVGVILEVVLNECFYTWKGAKAYLNGKEIHVTSTDSVSGSLIATGFPYYDFSRMKPFLETLDYFFSHSHGVRRIGSAATDLAYVACGRFEAFYEYSLSPWDVAAGALLVKQAGGVVSDFKKGDNFIFGREIVATNASVYDEFINIVQKFL